MRKLYIYLFVSRNKDNKHLPNFKERRQAFLEYNDNMEEVMKKFTRFVEEGQSGELARCYRSVNARNEDAVKKELMIRLLKDDHDVRKLNKLLISCAQAPQCRAEHKWLIDFDTIGSHIFHFCDDLVQMCGLTPDMFTIYSTVNGHAIVVDRGFDTRAIFEKYKDCDITLKKDDFLLIDYLTKDEDFFELADEDFEYRLAEWFENHSEEELGNMLREAGVEGLELE